MLFSFTLSHCAMNAKMYVKTRLISSRSEAALSASVADSGVLAVSLTVLSDFILCRQSSSHLFFSHPRPSRKKKSNILEEYTGRIGHVPIIRAPSTRHSNASSSFSQILYMDVIMIYQCTQSDMKKK